MKSFKNPIYNHSPNGDIFLIEQDLKTLYELNANCFESDIEQIRLQLKQINNRYQNDLYFSSILSEDAFIVPQNDVAILRHPRYLPAIPHYHDFFEIVYVLQGSAEHYTGKQKQVLTPGNILILAPGSTHALSAKNDDALIINFLLRRSTFDKTFMKVFENGGILKMFFQNTLYNKSEHSYLEFHSKPDPHLEQIVQLLYEEECSNQRYSAQAKNQLLSLFFIMLLRNHEKDIILPPAKENNVHENNIIFILKYMESNYNHISLQDLCKFFNYSPRHMIRLIQKYTGMTFSENILQLRLKKAASMLTDSTYSITSICEEIGFSNLNRFKNAFIKEYGCTPKEYRSRDCIYR